MLNPQPKLSLTQMYTTTTTTTAQETQAYEDFVRDLIADDPNAFIYVSPTNDFFLN